MKRGLLFLCFITIFIITLSCGDGINDPLPGSRDYTWTVDTLDLGKELLTLNKIWASSPNDVWAVGFGTSVNISVWHYDGINWKLFPSDGVGAQGIWGFSKTNVWIASEYDKIWRYDGTKLTLVKQLSFPGYGAVVLSDIYGISSADIYAVGFAQNYVDNSYQAVIVHYNGLDWTYVDIPLIREGFNTIRYSSRTRSYYIQATALVNNIFTEKLYKLNGNVLKEVFSTNSAGIGMGLINGDLYPNSDSKIYVPNGDKLDLWKNFSNTSYESAVYGKSENDFIGGAIDGIGHYNGTDFKTIYKTGIQLTDRIMIGNDIFVLGNDYKNKKRVIFHGVLKK